MKITKELEDSCCIFYLTFYDLDPISLAIDWLKKEAFNITLEIFNQAMNTKLVFLLTKEKFHNANKFLAISKSPRLDGILTKFYVKFWYIICDDLFNMFENSLSIGRFSKGIVKGLIILIFKVGNNKWLGN